MVRYKIHGLDEIKTKIKCKFFTLGRVIFELEALGKREKKIAKEIILVKQILKNNDIKIIDSHCEDVDAELLEKSKEGYIIATNDKLLREKIKKAGGKSIFIRSLNFIETNEIEPN
jgi:rRNA-processing protein FCF1